jgi:hypothetical protein
MSYAARGPALAGIDGRGALERGAGAPCLRGDATAQARREPAHQPRANRPLPGRTFAKSAKVLLHLPRANAISRRFGHPRMKASLVEASA